MVKTIGTEVFQKRCIGISTSQISFIVGFIDGDYILTNLNFTLDFNDIQNESHSKNEQDPNSSTTHVDSHTLFESLLTKDVAMQIRSILPRGLKILAISTTTKIDQPSKLASKLRSTFPELFYKQSKTTLLCISTQTDSQTQSKTLQVTTEDDKPIELEIDESQVSNLFVKNFPVVIQANASFSFDVSDKNTQDSRKILESKFHQIETQINNLDQSIFILSTIQNDAKNTTTNTIYLNKNTDDSSISTLLFDSKRKQTQNPAGVNAQLALLSIPNEQTNTQPIVSVLPDDVTDCVSNISLQSILYVKVGNVSKLNQRLRKALLAQLSYARFSVDVLSPTHRNVSFLLFKNPQFSPLCLSLPFPTNTNSSNDSNSIERADLSSHMLQTRLKYHSFLSLPAKKPILKIANSVNSVSENDLNSNASGSVHLVDVHAKLNLASQVTGGKQYCVEGPYEYYHYKQDGMNDDGWGCAYRSLQTLCSWFRLNGYSNKSVPTHRQIQQMLVDMGAMEKKLIGSSDWIGANEVGYCLQKQFGIDFKIINVQSGHDIAKHMTDLIQHFRTQGTPIMIGGGVLAYTLLGVDFNKETNDMRFLILDPHYTGVDELKPIRDRWCGWKQLQLFQKNSFYNLCLPLKPNEV